MLVVSAGRMLIVRVMVRARLAAGEGAKLACMQGPRALRYFFQPGEYQNPWEHERRQMRTQTKQTKTALLPSVRWSATNCVTMCALIILRPTAV